MIHYIPGRNLGHLTRCVAVISKFQKKSSEPVTVHTFMHARKWLRSNLPKVHLQSFDRRKFVERKITRSKLVIHDWREEVKALKQMNPKSRPIIGGIYHSDLSISRHDTEPTRKFKQQVRDLSELSTDIFFHINLLQPKRTPKLSTCYVPVPIIVREIGQTRLQVKRRLGIPADEPFILVQMGGGRGKYRYSYIHEWYKKINRLQSSYRIVVAGQFGRSGFPFKKHIIQAPLLRNGRDLVNAADLVISKPGMGILVDCISTGTPLLSLPADSKEREVKNFMLRELLDSDICIASNSFSAKTLAWRIKEVMAHSNDYRNAFKKVPQNGSEIVAKSIKLVSGQSLSDLPDIHQEILKLTPFQIK